MDTIVLPPGPAAIRAAEEQAGVLIDLYRDAETVAGMRLPDGFVTARLSSLRDLRKVLRAALEDRDLLPGAANPESVDFARALEALGGALNDEPRAVPIAEEGKLLEQCEAIAEHEPAVAKAIEVGSAACREAIVSLKA